MKLQLRTDLSAMPGEWRKQRVKHLEALRGDSVQDYFEYRALLDLIDALAEVGRLEGLVLSRYDAFFNLAHHCLYCGSEWYFPYRYEEGEPDEHHAPDCPIPAIKEQHERAAQEPSP